MPATNLGGSGSMLPQEILDFHIFLEQSGAFWAQNLILWLLINPRRMREGYGSRSVCVYVCVCVCVYVCVTSCYIPVLYDANKVSLGFLRHFQGMHCMDFVENASFKKSGDICWPPWPSSLSCRSIKETDYSNQNCTPYSKCCLANS